MTRRRTLAQESTELELGINENSKMPTASRPQTSILGSTPSNPPHPHPHSHSRPGSDGTNFSFPSPFENNLPFDYDTPNLPHAHADVLDTVDKKRKRSESDADSQLTAFNGAPQYERPEEITQPAVTYRAGITGTSTLDGPPRAKLSRKADTVEARFAQRLKDHGITREVILQFEADIEARDKANPPNPPKATKPKKALRAKESSWADIPDWKGREDSPVLSLPAEVLDRCFGLRGDLFTRDYVALAGTCKFFRHHLNDDFFRELCTFKHIPRFHETPSIFDSPKPRITPKIIHAHTPFTRLLDDWRCDPTIAGLSDSSALQGGSRGGSGSGSGSPEMSQEDRLDRLMFENEPGMGLRIRSGMGGCVYGVLAILDGRTQGEVVVEKDEEGMPLKAQSGVWFRPTEEAQAGPGPGSNGQSAPASSSEASKTSRATPALKARQPLPTHSRGFEPTG